MVPTTHAPFKEMKALIHGSEKPQQCFDQNYFAEQCRQRPGEVETILTAISRKMDHLKGVNFAELMETETYEEQGSLLVSSLFKHTDHSPNIQMLALLKQQGFLKRIEPTPTSNISRTPEAPNSPRSNPTGTDNLSETLGHMSVGPETLSGADNSTLDSGIQPDLKSNDNDDAA